MRSFRLGLMMNCAGAVQHVVSAHVASEYALHTRQEATKTNGTTL